jgi:dTDP-4-amino-4,6-dideoxygalactose transaminase
MHEMNDETIPFARPFIGKKEEEAVLRVLRSGVLTTGPEALAFEKEFAAFLNPEHADPSRGELRCVLVNSATSGLHLAAEACGLGAGDLVLLPSYTFTSTAEVTRYLGAEPVFIDVAPGTFHLDPEALEYTLERISRGLPAYPPRPGERGSGFGPKGKAAAIMPVHIGGLPCGMKEILSAAKRYACKVVEDAAHAFPSRLDDGSFAGTLGDAGVFSFYATKTITTGEGGMIATRDKKIAERAAILRSHGIDRAFWARYTDTKASWYYQVVEAGYKYNMPDILAAIGRVQLSRAMELLRMREAIAARYNEAFAHDERFIIPPGGPGNAWHLYPIRLNAAGKGRRALSRDECIVKLQEKGVGVSVHFIPLHTMPYYKKRYGLAENDLGETMKSYRDVISLPIWPGMTDAQIDRVIAALRALY